MAATAHRRQRQGPGTAGLPAYGRHDTSDALETIFSIQDRRFPAAKIT